MKKLLVIGVIAGVWWLAKNPGALEGLEGKVESLSRAARAGDIEQRLKEFAEANIPKLQKAIDETRSEIEHRQDLLGTYTADLEALNHVPDSDASWKSWRRAIEELERQLDVLRARRQSAYLEWRRYELAPSEQVEHRKLLEEADEAADAALATLRKIRAEGTTTRTR